MNQNFLCPITIKTIYYIIVNMISTSKSCIVITQHLSIDKAVHVSSLKNQKCYVLNSTVMKKHHNYISKAFILNFRVIKETNNRPILHEIIYSYACECTTSYYIKICSILNEHCIYLTIPFQT